MSEICEGELTTLESIFEKELKIIDKKYPQKFELKISGQCHHDSHLKVMCTLLFEYILEYPDAPAKCTIKKSLNLSEFQKEIINDLARSVAERSLGFIMIFDIVSEVQEKLNEFAEIMHQKEEKKKDEERIAKELEEEKKFTGTKLTIETFLVWKEAFLNDPSVHLKIRESRKSDDKRLTGRELFLRDNRFDDSDLQFLTSEGGEIVEVDERLFVDLDELDLDDDDEPEEISQDISCT
ncbi:unnamed protein product [Protopolystoma xenopodis]|uniref:RWD domain-containing protein n=1 Tax=Protopolystoma xenopodis TaxID=117903 RepID=A0A3S5FFR2_9PLAT|nr:unnamed protein product [Protopolystoma xenopodis]